MRRDPHTGAPDFFGFARDYLHAYMPKTRGMSPKTVEAYRISLECFLDYLAEAEHIAREQVSFDHFERPYLKGWLSHHYYRPKSSMKVDCKTDTWGYFPPYRMLIILQNIPSLHKL